MTFGNYFDGIETMNSSSTSESTADDVNENAEINACAMLINLSVDAGQYSAVYAHKISDNLRSTLESNGYTIKPWGYPHEAAVPEEVSVISWRG